METSSSDATNLHNNGGASSRSLQFPPLRFTQSSVSSLLDYSGIRRARPDYPNSEAQNPRNSESTDGVGGSGDSYTDSGSSNGNDEVSIRVDDEREMIRAWIQRQNGGRNGVGWRPEEPTVAVDLSNENANSSANEIDDVQRMARWMDKINLPCWLLLLVVFVRQQLLGFVAAIYIIAILFKSNDILRKQTALRGDRKISVLVGYSIVFMLNIFGLYWWHRKAHFSYSFLMIPPKEIPPFWHVILIILVNDAMARQAAMVVKLILLMYYKNGKGHNLRRQGQMLTLVEYTLLLYRTLLPTPVWYRFFLNKEYGTLFSSLITGLYLTFKLTSIVEKVRSVFAALKALSRKGVEYGSRATSKQVKAAGDLCAICQEKMRAPILLRCKHVFCEECVLEWFERERTCPLCRAVVRPADLLSYGDGSTSLQFHLF